MRRILAFYKFHPLSDVEHVRDELEQLGLSQGIKGTILIAGEGVNGTIVGEEPALHVIQAALEQKVGAISFKWSDLDTENLGFYRYKVKVKPEIVSFGVDDLDLAQTGKHVSPQRWHELLDDPNVVVIDTRNTYEIDIGTFPSALSPDTTNFREFPQWVEQNLDPQSTPAVAMFCTGGIRCEKASAYMRQAGFDNVYQLDGGILQYLEDVEPGGSRWDGECFVFDQRVSVNEELGQGQYKQCYACRHPLSADDLSADSYEKGVSCRYCFGERDEVQNERFRDRQHQVNLAAERGQQHIGQRQE